MTAARGPSDGPLRPRLPEASALAASSHKLCLEPEMGYRWCPCVPGPAGGTARLYQHHLFMCGREGGWAWTSRQRPPNQVQREDPSSPAQRERVSVALWDAILYHCLQYSLWCMNSIQSSHPICGRKTQNEGGWAGLPRSRQLAPRAASGGGVTNPPDGIH